jgi:phosphate/sulfate permease
MRYLVAMIFAVSGAALTMLFASSTVATWAVDQMVFESPDDVGNVHTLIFMAVNLGGLLVGWFVGWMIGGPLSTDQSSS